jgi:hypothetical protein
LLILKLLCNYEAGWWVGVGCFGISFSERTFKRGGNTFKERRVL